MITQGVLVKLGNYTYMNHKRVKCMLMVRKIIGGNNGGYSYLKFVNGKFEPIDKSQLTASLAQSGKNVVLKTFDSYNARRYSKPWVAKVNSKGKPDFSEDVGKFSGQPGESGELYVYEPVDGQVYMFGQKDYCGGNTVSKYMVFTNGEFQ